VNNNIKIISLIGLSLVGLMGWAQLKTTAGITEVPACNASVAIEVVLRNSVALEADDRQNDEPLIPEGAIKEKILALAHSWQPHLESIVQTNYDAANGFRYCAAEAVEKMPPQITAELIPLIQQLPKETLGKLVEHSVSAASLNTQTICARRVSYKIGLTQDTPSQVYVWWQCDE
jgi:hypothetical protein